MTLATFTPAVGPKAGGGAYTLPTVKTRPTSSLAFGADQTTPEESIGEHLAAGTGTAWPGARTTDVVFQFTGAFLAANGYPVTYGGMMTAWNDFQQWVIMGGLGVWKDIPPANTKYGGVSGTVIDHYNFTGRLDSQADFLPLGDTDAEFTATITCPGGLVTVIDGGGTTLGYLPFT